MSILDGVKLLEWLSETDKQNLAMFCQLKHLSSWETLFKEWDEATAMYFLVSWNIEISKSLNWQNRVLWEVNAEEILWEMAVFWETWKRMATATALTECRLIVVLSFSIKELTLKNPQLLEKIKEIINYRMIENKNIKK